jgi:hypothetical protein
MKAAFSNNYFVNGTAVPDVTIFDNSVVSNGISGVQCAGFFGNDWSVENGDFAWRKSFYGQKSLRISEFMPIGFAFFCA